jgi:NACalpha-BTF3-like transcription factor
MANWTWGEIAIAQEMAQVFGGAAPPEPNRWYTDEVKRKKVIRLICKVNGETIDEKKEKVAMKITVKDVKLVVKKVLGIELEIK